jgi:hypothetical protein
MFIVFIVVTEKYKRSSIWHAFLLVAEGAADWDRVCDASPLVWAEEFIRRHRTEVDVALYVAVKE